MTFLRDGRILVGEQSGTIRVVKNDEILEEAFYHIDADFQGERGLLGIAADPDFENNQYVYVYYTVGGSPAHNRVSRLKANGDIALEGSEEIILELDDLSEATIHNGGALQFGLDNKLYVAVGENANSSKAQDLDSYFGKLLRINPDGSVPDGNPFEAGSEQRKRIWAYGLRNPFTFSIQPETGKIFVNDVGQSGWEEINDATAAGRNFGWPSVEGPGDNPNFVNPVYSYPQTGPKAGCAITGGTFFNPGVTTYPGEYYGTYFFMDFCNGWIRNLNFLEESPVDSDFSQGGPIDVISLTTGPDGNLYFLDRHKGSLYRIIYNTSTEPYIVNHPDDLIKPLGSQIILNVEALGTPPLTYQWHLDGQEIEGANAATFAIESAELADSGDYSVTVSNADGQISSNVANVRVISNPPSAFILSPEHALKYTAGTEISFSGIGIDVEDGILSENSFHWNINFHHDDHKHDQPPVPGKQNGTFYIPNEGETSDNVWYRIILTVTDSNGLQGKDSVDVMPVKSTIQLSTLPAGLPVTVDGQIVKTPSTIVTVAGLRRTIGIVQGEVSLGGQSFYFERWSHGGESIQSFKTLTTDTTFTAVFQSKAPFILVEPVDVTVEEGSPVSLNAEVIGDPTLSYQWTKYEQPVQGQTSAYFSIDSVRMDDAGQYRLIVTNDFGTAQTRLVRINVIPSHPVAQIISPAQHSYRAGYDIEFAGTAMDVDDGILMEEAFQWEVFFFHNSKKEKVYNLNGSKSGSFSIPNHGNTSADVWYRIVLSVKDSKGFLSKDSVDLHPITSIINLQTVPPGREITLDGIDHKTPLSIVSVEGLLHTIGIPQEQDADPQSNIASYEFDAWQHGGDIFQTVVTPAKDTTFTAIFNIILGIEESAVQKSIGIFPNPVKQKGATLKVSASKVQPMRITMFNFLSKQEIAWEVTLTQGVNSIPIDLSGFANGLYFLVVETNGERGVVKIVLAR